MEKYKQDFIKFMVECQVLRFGDFVTKSGRNTPFFVNTGFYRTGSQLARLGGFYADAIADKLGTEFDVLFGPAYKGIPLSVATAIALNNKYGIDVGYCSNRKEVKDHGDKGILLGSPLQNGTRMVIIEDVTTAGTSIDETMPIVRAQADVNVLGLVVSVDRQERGKGTKSALQEIRDSYGFDTTSIVTMTEVVEYLSKNEVDGKTLLNKKLLEAIDDYYKQYGV